MSSKKLTFEEAMGKLEEAAEALDRDDIKLEDAIKKYEEGIRYYNQCKEILDGAKQKIEVLKQ